MLKCANITKVLFLKCIKCAAGVHVQLRTQKDQNSAPKATHFNKSCGHTTGHSNCRACWLHYNNGDSWGIFCKHGTQKSRCRICKGRGVCIHDRLHFQCLIQSFFGFTFHSDCVGALCDSPARDVLKHLAIIFFNNRHFVPTVACTAGSSGEYGK
jgi:hypothetical protein